MATHFPKEIFSNILSYCNETIEQKRDRLWKSISVEREYYEKGDSYSRYGYRWADSPQNIYYLAESSIKFKNLKETLFYDYGVMRRDVFPLWKLADPRLMI